MSTITIGVNEARAHFSDYIARALRGDRVSVTKNGRVVAQIAPPDETGESARVEKARKAVEAWKAHQAKAKLTLGGLSVKALRDEGRP